MNHRTASTRWPALNLKYGLKKGTPLATNLMVRSALFSTHPFHGSAVRPNADNEPILITSLSQYQITQVAGDRLSQSDADLFYWILSKMYENGAPTGRVTFKRSEVFAALDIRSSGEANRLFLESLDRLQKAEFVFKLKSRKKFATKLISQLEFTAPGNKTLDVDVFLGKGVATLLADNGYRTLDGVVLKKLGKNPLAKGLYAFYASHSNYPHPIKGSTLKSLTGRETMQESKWQIALESALALVQVATKWKVCGLMDHGSDKGKVVILKKTSSQWSSTPLTELDEFNGGFH